MLVPRFACDYGTQCALADDADASAYRSPCGTDQRPRDAVADPACSDDRIVDRATGECRDACFVDRDGNVHLEEERFSASASTIATTGATTAAARGLQQVPVRHAGVD